MLFFYSLTLNGLNKAEDYHLEEELYGITTIIDNELQDLSSIVKNYAYWDDMYNYVNSHAKLWEKRNITDWIPTNFKVDLILIFDNAGIPIYRYGDFEEFKEGKDLAGLPLIKNALNSRGTKEFLLTSKGMLYVASSQIMHTDESGPRNGTYLYGRLINLQKIKDVTRVDLSLIAKNGVISSSFTGPLQRPKNLAGIYNDLAAKKYLRFNIHKPNYEFAFVYALLKDSEGLDIAMLELIRPRRSIAVLINTIIKASLLVLLLVILMVGITVWLITRVILNSLGLLNKTIQEIQRTKDTLRRVKIDSGDEIGSLSKNFNAMMDALNKAQDALSKAQGDLTKSERITAAAELALGAVHQINNPLSIATGRIQLLRRLIDYKTPIPQADLEKDLNIIEEQTKRAINITNSLLRYANPVMLRFERCDVNEVLHDIIGLIKEMFAEKNIVIIEDLKMDLPNVRYCDIEKMRDVFMNLITNAQQAMPEGGKLAVSTGYDENQDEVTVKFTDNGFGIPEDDINKLFTPFFSTAAQRSGLGLAISDKIVKGHRGKIVVESEPGKGSIFTVRLPADTKKTG